jgi:hypothetical protein
MRSITAGFCLAAMFAGATPAHGQGLGTKLQLGAFGGLSAPKGELRQETKTGWNAGGLFKMRIAGPLDARLDGSYTDLGTRAFSGTNTTIRSKANIIFGALNAELNLGPDSAQYPGDNSISPYILAGVGKYKSNFDVTCSGDCSLILTTADERTAWGFNFGAGANVPLGPVPTFVDFRYHRFGTRFPGLGEEGTGTLVTASVGVKLR